MNLTVETVDARRTRHRDADRHHGRRIRPAGGPPPRRARCGYIEDDHGGVDIEEVAVRRWLLAAAVISGACGDGNSVSGPGGDAQKVLVGLVEIEEVTVSGSSPSTVVAHVRGYLPDPCWVQTSIDQQWHGPWVNVWIVMERPADAQCVQVIQPFEMDIPITGITGPGTYIVRVNGEGREIRI
jgi:hypothetical protein